MRQYDSKNAMGIVQCAYIICNRILRILNKMPITISNIYPFLHPSVCLSFQPSPLSPLLLSHSFHPFPSLLSYYLFPFIPLSLSPFLVSLSFQPSPLSPLLLSFSLSILTHSFIQLPLHFFVFILEMITRHQDLLGDYGVA